MFVLCLFAAAAAARAWLCAAPAGRCMCETAATGWLLLRLSETNCRPSCVHFSNPQRRAGGWFVPPARVPRVQRQVRGFHVVTGAGGARDGSKQVKCGCITVLVQLSHARGGSWQVWVWLGISCMH